MYYQDLATRIMRAQRRSVAIQLRHRLISIRVVQSLNASEIIGSIHQIFKKPETYKHTEQNGISVFIQCYSQPSVRELSFVMYISDLQMHLEHNKRAANPHR